MPKPKSRKNVDEHFKLAAVQRLQTGDVPANELAKELDVSIWSLRKWSRIYRKKVTAGAGAVGEPVAPATKAEELPASPSTEPVAPPVVEPPPIVRTPEPVDAPTPTPAYQRLQTMRRDTGRR